MSKQLLIENETQIFSASFVHGANVTYNFIVSLQGKDGRNRPVWVGKMKIDGPSENQISKSESHIVALVTHHNNPLHAAPLAIFFAKDLPEAKEAAWLAIDDERKGYGGGYSDHIKNWTPFLDVQFHVEGYDYED